MTINYTTLLELGQPVTGTESGDWGNDVNNAITSYLDTAIAGTQTITGDANVTLSLTRGTSSATNLAQVGAGTTGSAQYAVILCSGARTAARNIVVPASSRTYVVINSTTGGFGVVVKGSATTGVTVAAGETAIIVYNSAAAVADYVKVASSTSGTVTSVGGTGTVNGISLSGTVTSSGSLTLGGALTGVNLGTQVTGTLPIANGGTGTTSTTFVNAATNVTGTLPFANGGTGETTRQAAMDALAGAVTSGSYLRGNGTDVVMATIQAGDVPTLNQNTSGTAAGLSTTLAVGSGGTGATTLAANNVILGNGTSAVQVVAPGTAGNVLTSNGTTWASTAAGASLSGVTESTTPFETALGYQAGNVNTGVNNTYLGYQAGLVNTSGTNNTHIGYQAGKANITGIRQTIVGAGAGAVVTASHNTLIGYNAGNVLTSGDSNVIVGGGAGEAITTNGSSTFIGYQAGGSVTAAGGTYLGRFNGNNGSTMDLTTTTNVVCLSSGSTNPVMHFMPSKQGQLYAALMEKLEYKSAAATGTINFDAADFSVLYYSLNATANQTLNVRANSSLTLQSQIYNYGSTQGSSVTVAYIVKNGATAYYPSTFQIDGTTRTVLWQGGTAPTSGNANSTDVYVYTMLYQPLIGTWVVFGSQTKFA